MSFKKAIKEARLKVGISQEKAGDSIHRTRNAIRGYESGISTPDPDQLVILCKLYKTTPNDLLGFFQQQNEEAKMENKTSHTKLPWVANYKGSLGHIKSIAGTEKDGGKYPLTPI